MGVDTALNREGNEKLWQRLQREVGELRNMGCKILMAGDFNGHIGGNGEDWEGWGKRNVNGKALMKLVKSHNLVIGNRLGCCKGRVTWRRGEQKSVVDFIIMDAQVAGGVEEIVIDELQERWSTNADHNWIKIVARGWECGRGIEIEKGQKWQLGEKARWGLFRQQLEEELEVWKRDVPQMEDMEGGVQLAYRELL